MTGATGLVGTALCQDLAAAGSDVQALSRRARDGDDVSWFAGDPCEPGDWRQEAASADAVVHLAGESVASGRWTATRKRELVRSRVDSTRNLVDAFEATADADRPEVFVCASACGYYGARGEEKLFETSHPGSDFLAQLCVDWEAEADRAAALGIRVVKLRFGVILSGQGGALDSMRPIFRLGLGGPLGPASRFFPWVSLDDAVGLTRFAIESEVDGALNVVAPEAVRMGEFATTLGQVLRRPAVLPVPEFALRLALGEMGGSLVPGQRVIPDVPMSAGYTFRRPSLRPTLESCIE